MCLEDKAIGVIGGGPAGMLCAAYMAKHGATVTVFERNDPSKSPVSDSPRPWWNIGLSRVARTAIEGAGLSAEFDPEWWPEGMAIHAVGKPALFFGTWEPTDPVEQLALITQPEIVSHLRRECSRVYGSRVRVEAGVQVVGGDICGGEVLVEGPADMSQQVRKFDLVVGADGIWSVARRLMQEQDPEMLVSTEASELCLLGCRVTPQGNPATYEHLDTPSGAPFLGKPPLHSEPLTGSSMSFFLTDPKFKAYPGIDSVTLSVRDGGAEVSAALACTPKWFEAHSAGSEAQTGAELAAALPNMPTVWINEVTAAVCNRDSMGLWLRPLHFVTCSKIASDRAVLIGDAAHAMSPNLGMGCNSALLDAATLSRCISAVAGDTAAVAAAFNAARLQDVQSLTRISRKLNDASNYSYHGSFLKLLWGAPVMASLIAGFVLHSEMIPGFLKPRREIRTALHETGEVKGLESDTVWFFYRSIATAMAVAGLAAFGAFKGAAVLTVAGMSLLRR